MNSPTPTNRNPMTPIQIQKALDIMAEHNIPESQAVQILGMVAVSLHKSARLEKATRLGVSVADLDGADLGKSIGSRLNQRFGWGAK